MIKIVYCIQSTSNSGGMERVLSNKVNYLVEHGYDITIITTDQQSRRRFFHFDPRIKFFDLDINYTSTNGKSLLKKVSLFPYKLYLNYIRLKKLLKTIRPDIVISMFDNDALILPIVKDGSKKVLEIHFSRLWRKQRERKGLWKIMDNFRSMVDLWLAKRFDQFVVLTNEDKENWHGCDKIDVIYNLLSFEPKTVSPLTTQRVLAVGRMSFQKNFSDLIDIWKMIYLEFPHWQLSIVGGGELQQELEQQVKANGLTSCITIEPPTKNMEVWYLDSSILAMTSRFEGLPMVLLEAQSFGLPIISYACKCGPRDIITDGEDGFLINQGDKEQFANKLSMMMKDRQKLLSMGQHAKKASLRFTEDNVMKKWENLFQKLLQ